MGFTYQSISRAAYHLAPGSGPWIGDYRALPFPEHARASLLDLYNHGRTADHGDPYLTVPTRRLDGVLQSLAPDLVVRGRPSVTMPSDQDFWLYAPAELPHPLPDETMNQLLAVWLQDLGSSTSVGTPGYQKQLLKTLDDLKAAPLEWKDELGLDLLGCALTAGGTAAPAARQYQLATDAFARRIVKLDPYDFGAGTLRFRAIPRGPRQQGAELMSQPLSAVIKGKTWWFSVTINISLHTAPLDPRPRLHLHTGVRRWATHPRTKAGTLHLPSRRSTTVYLLPAIPWLPGAPISERYAVAQLSYDHRTRAVNWRENGPAGILRRLALRQSFPDPEELMSAPEQWLIDGPGTQGAVVHSNHMGAHGIGVGLMSHQRSEIAEWAEQALPVGLIRAQPLNRSTIGAHKPANARPAVTGAAKLTAEARAAHDRRCALAVAVRMNSIGVAAAIWEPPVIEAQLLWQTETLRDAAVTSFAEILGLDGADGISHSANVSGTTEPDSDSTHPTNEVVHQWLTPELTIRLRCRTLSGGIADKLAVDAKGSRSTALAQAVMTRRAELSRFLIVDGASPESLSLALVEIAHPSTFLPSITDPKFALRLGCADAGVLTQFVVVPSNAVGIKTETNVEHRVRSGWLDGLRQLGVRVLPEHTLAGELPDNLRYAATWMVKRRKDGPTRLPLHMPVAVLVTPLADDGGRAHVQGWDDDAKTWIPYPKFLLWLVKKAEITTPEPESELDGTAEPASRNRITRSAWRKNLEEQRKETESFMQRVLYSLRNQPTVLITHSQNSRQHWRWLQDGQSMADLIKSGHAPASSLHHNLRLVRIRGAAGRETPQWWGNGSPGGSNGLPAGLWTQAPEPGADQRVFYSTTEKASQFTASAVGADRLAPRTITRGARAGDLTIDSDKPAWNPSLVEIAVLGCHPYAEEGRTADKPETIALAMHQLRQAPDYLDALSLPLPLHLAGLAQEYVLPTLSDDQPAGEDANESTEDMVSEPDPDLAPAPGLAQEPPEHQLALFP